MEYKYIELFAGCGGMSLGLEAAGFELTFANELSPMAGETFSYNLLNEDLRSDKNWNKTIWLRSQYGTGDIRRFTEDPRSFKNMTKQEFYKTKDLSGKLIIGEVQELIDSFKNNHELSAKYKEKVTLVSGGPPCQSFSLAGRREKENGRNKLPWQFAEFVELIKPQFVILENVSGILRPFLDEGKKYFAWFEIAKAFALKGYVPICMHINASNFGIPQNRPRFILLGIRNTLLSKRIINSNLDEVLQPAIDLFKKVNKYGDLHYADVKYKYFDYKNKADIKLFEENPFLLSNNGSKGLSNVKDAIDILKRKSEKIPIQIIKEDPYHKWLEKELPPSGKLKKFEFIVNNDQRTHQEKTRNRFQLYKSIERLADTKEKNQFILALRNGSPINIRKETKIQILKDCSFIESIDNFDSVIGNLKTKKNSQKPLKAEQLAPAALTIPDDICHYDNDENRTLTVREMARIQTFPDWFEFKSKDTTGGIKRRFEVPNYTQIGNAVPPILGKFIGRHIIDLAILLELDNIN